MNACFMTIKMLSLGAALLVAVQSPAAILESADSRVKGLSVERTDNNLLVNMTSTSPDLN